MQSIFAKFMLEQICSKPVFEQRCSLSVQKLVLVERCTLSVQAFRGAGDALLLCKFISEQRCTLSVQAFCRAEVASVCASYSTAAAEQVPVAGADLSLLL